MNKEVGNLVVSRKEFESVIISHQGEQLKITVLEFNHKAQVKLSFCANKNFKFEIVRKKGE